MNALLAILAADSGGSALGGLLPLLILAPLIYMMIVPQRKAKKKAAEMLAALSVGDDVVTSGGIHGYVTFLEDNIAHVQVDTDVVIRVTKAALTRTTPVADVEEPAVDVTDEVSDDVPTKPSKSTKS